MLCWLLCGLMAASAGVGYSVEPLVVLGLGVERSIFFGVSSSCVLEGSRMLLAMDSSSIHDSGAMDSVSMQVFSHACASRPRLGIPFIANWREAP